MDLVSSLLGISFGVLALVTAGGIYGIFSGAMSERAIAVIAAPFYEEFLKAGGIFVLALKNRKFLKPWRTVATYGFLAGLIFGVGEGLAQPSIYRSITAPTHALETMVFALGVRFMVFGKGRRAEILPGICITAPIVSHMLWNAFAPLVLP
jgi:RsiW-degrading membrane proteinase PrsW (M82 family)